MRSDEPWREPEVQDEPADEYTVVEQEPSLRILVEYEGLRLLVFIDPNTARRAISTKTSLQASSSSINKDCGVTLAPGFSPELLEQHGTHTHIRYKDELVSIEGFVESSALGIVYKPQFVEAESSPNTLQVKLDVPLRSKTDSTPLAYLRAGTLLESDAEADPTKANVPVRLRILNAQHALQLEARGVVSLDSIQPCSDCKADGTSGSRIRSSSHVIPLPDGQLLYAIPDPESPPVAQAQHGAAALDIRRKDNQWDYAEVSTPWGDVTLLLPRCE